LTKLRDFYVEKQKEGYKDVVFLKRLHLYIPLGTIFLHFFKNIAQLTTVELHHQK